MIEVEQTFNKYIREILEEMCPEVHFYPEPEFEELEYPAVVVHYDDESRTDTLGMWSREAQFAILVNERNRAAANIILQKLLRRLGVTADIPGTLRRIPKFQFMDEEGNLFPSPIQLDSDIRWDKVEPVQTINEAEMPDLIHKVFTLVLFYRDH